MLKRFIDIRTSLTARIFLMTIVILLISSSVTYLFLAWATPISYRSIIADNLNEKVDRLISDLAETTFEESGPLISRLRRRTTRRFGLRPETEKRPFCPAMHRRRRLWIQSS